MLQELKEQAVLSVEATVKARAQAKGNRSGSKLLEASHLRLCGLEVSWHAGKLTVVLIAWPNRRLRSQRSAQQPASCGGVRPCG